jgi:hypothetical protein
VLSTFCAEIFGSRPRAKREMNYSAGQDRAEGEEDFSALEERAARLLREARELPHGAERAVFLDEIEQFIARLSALKAKITVRIIKHEAVPNSGSFEVKYSDGQPSRYFYFEDVPGHQLRSEQMTMEQALEAAKALARRERDQR